MNSEKIVFYEMSQESMFLTCTFIPERYRNFMKSFIINI